MKKLLKRTMILVGMASIASCGLIYPSSGQIGSPVDVTTDVASSGTYTGSVDGINSSYHVFYGNSPQLYTVTLDSVSNDADLYLYGDDSTFTSVSCFSAHSGIDPAQTDICPVMSTGTVYIEVRPVSLPTQYYLDIF